MCPDYIYDKVDYKNCSTKVKIGCATHGYFNISPNNFLRGYGCPKCSAGFFESFVRYVFEILFKTKFNKIRPSWLRRDPSNWRSNLELDGYAYIDFLNIALAFEYQGEQHEMIVSKFKMKQEDLIKNQKYDQIKRDKCKDCGVYLIEIPYFNKNFKLQDLKEFIKNKCIELGITLITDFDSIVIDVGQIANKIIGRNYSPHLAGISTEQISTSFSKHDVFS